MKDWENRPPEIASLLNPAFCGLLIAISLVTYTRKINEGAPFAFPFVMLPLVLHEPTRKIFPRSARTTFLSWITNKDTAIAKVGFAERARNMIPYTRESLTFAMQHNTICVTASGRLKISPPVPRRFSNATPEVKDCINAASICGNWFSQAGDIKTAMALLGVKP